ncbi:translocation/assembly module TamB domain-containing protein [Nitratiruptor sp. YY09-18]|uniref:translocation/assembly module TamB domain-containing protein n=1 Tax=Nitratiruptor sp. YY09-18 TaxID=2724901 RepID=UPI001916890A|nr:translocation/assembly module TamB domain-containing protein [Nitratiruptor sp. YY09-18]BCD67329.1 translocation and assembly module TamB [Nitratiruptor sp. YY09-18]
MRWLARIVEFLLVITLVLFFAESRWHTFSHLLDEFLQQQGVTLSWHLRSPFTIELDNIRYQNLPVAKRVVINYRILPLLHKKLIIKKAIIEGLDIESITKIKPPKQKKSKKGLDFSWQINKLIADATFKEYRFKLQASKITQESGFIDKLIAQSPKLGKVVAKGKYSNNRLRLAGKLQLKKFNPHLQLQPIPFSLSLTQKGINFTLKPRTIKYEQLLISRGIIEGFYDYKKLHATIKAPLLWQKTKANVVAKVFYNKELSYTFEANVTNPALPIPLTQKVYQKLSLTGRGDLHRVESNISSPLFDAKLVLKDFRDFTLQTSKIAMHELNETLPQDGWLMLQAQGNIHRVALHTQSNYFKLAAKLEKNKVEGDLKFLRKYKDFNLPALNPIRFITTSQKTHIVTNLGSIDLYKNLTGSIKIANATITIKKERQTLTLDASIKSLKHFIDAMKNLYPISLNNLDAECVAHGSYDTKAKHFTLHIQVQSIKSKKLNPFEFLQIDMHGSMQKVIIDYYSFVYNHHGFYATKPSYIYIDDKIRLAPLWFEDSIKITGWIDPSRLDAKLAISSPDYTYSSSEGKARVQLSLRALMQKGLVDIEGDLKLKNGYITYQPKKFHTVEDKDIIIVDKEVKQNTFIKDKVALDIHITAKNPIIYKIPDLYVLFKPDVTIYKEYQKPLQLLGVVQIIRGNYKLSGGDISFMPSTVSFYGPPTNPLLEIHGKTRRDRYTIFIDIMGDVENPIVQFDSDPYLPQNQILSMIAFGSGSQGAISKLLGGSRLGSLLSNFFVKDLLENFGIKLDKLSLVTQNGRVGFEIGKRISDKITILYKNDEISTLIIRYRINNHFESEAIFGPSKSGVHIYYQNTK